jgi:hypothetical protein
MRNLTLTPNLSISSSYLSLFRTFGLFLSFLKCPKPNKPLNLKKDTRLQVAGHIILTELIIKGFLLFMIYSLYAVFDVTLHPVNFKAVVGGTPFYLVAILVTIYGPLREELIFRLPLIYSRRFNLVALLVFLAGYAPIIMQEAKLNILSYLIATVGLMGLAAAVLLSPGTHSYIRQPWRKSYTSLYYVITFVFALQYLVNFPYINLPLFTLPILLMLQWVEGLFLGFVRINLGFTWCIVIHMINKTILLTVFINFFSTT